jgi:hypothetical protein
MTNHEAILARDKQKGGRPIAIDSRRPRAAYFRKRYLALQAGTWERREPVKRGVPLGTKRVRVPRSAELREARRKRDANMREVRDRIAAMEYLKQPCEKVHAITWSDLTRRA